MSNESVIPAKAGIQGCGPDQWIPAFAGMTPSPPALSHRGEREPAIAPGALGAQVGKRAYLYASGQSTTPSSTSDYAYVYDPVGNAWVILSDMGEEVYWFSQDAFGNELSISPFAGTSWQTARNAGITEHQTGKWIDPFTGSHFFNRRWYDSITGRFLSRSPLRSDKEKEYVYCHSNPVSFFDLQGAESSSSEEWWRICVPKAIEDFVDSMCQRKCKYCQVGIDGVLHCDNPQEEFDEAVGGCACYLKDQALSCLLFSIPVGPIGKTTRVSESFLKSHGIDPHEVKKCFGGGCGRFDLYKDEAGNIWGKLKRAPESLQEAWTWVASICE